jgi:hypothetical protein
VFSCVDLTANKNLQARLKIKLYPFSKQNHIKKHSIWKSSKNLKLLSGVTIDQGGVPHIECFWKNFKLKMNFQN